MSLEPLSFIPMMGSMFSKMMPMGPSHDGDAIYMREVPLSGAHQAMVVRILLYGKLPSARLQNLMRYLLISGRSAPGRSAVPGQGLNSLKPFLFTPWRSAALGCSSACASCACCGRKVYGFRVQGKGHQGNLHHHHHHHPRLRNIRHVTVSA